MIVLVAVIKIVEGKGEEFEREWRKIALKVRKDPGTVTFVLHREVKNPNKFLVYEKYESDEALKYHNSTYFNWFSKTVGPILADMEASLCQEVA
jgi:quinol monooxygenase YgiN